MPHNRAQHSLERVRARSDSTHPLGRAPTHLRLGQALQRGKAPRLVVAGDERKAGFDHGAQASMRGQQRRDAVVPAYVRAFGARDT